MQSRSVNEARTSSFYRGDLASPSGADEEVSRLVGRKGIYRLGFASMQVLNMPDQLFIGPIAVQNVVGPVQTQRTTVLQEPGFQPTFVKWMEHLGVGAERSLTIYSLDAVLPDDVRSAFRLWRSEALAAAGYLAMMLDERVAQERVLEDFSVFTPSGEVRARVDVEALVRTFEPSHPWFPEFGRELDRFVKSDKEPRLRAACRWYLRAATAGPTPDGFVLLWVAIEALIPAPGGGRARNQVRELETAIERAEPGLDASSMIDPPIGRLAGLRAQIVHQGLESDPMINEGFYTLESLTRLILRHEFGVAQGWPYFPGEPMLKEPFLSTPRPTRTIWRDPPRTVP